MADTNALIIRFTGKKAMLLADSVKDTWAFFWKTGMEHVFIANYESLKKYFARKINKAGKWTLKDAVFDERIKLFKPAVIDESHKVKSTSTQPKFCKGIAQGKEYIVLLAGTPVVR